MNKKEMQRKNIFLNLIIDWVLSLSLSLSGRGGIIRKEPQQQPNVHGKKGERKRRRRKKKK